MGYNRSQKQMKKTLLLALATLFATVTFAQQQLATLNHNDSISVFYGANALVQAHAAAIHGDVITLSSGTFNSATITKEITIRGNGMMRDNIAGTDPTVINELHINIPDDSTFVFGLEAVEVLNTLYYTNGVSPTFSKCQINRLDRESQWSSCSLQNATFINCVINRIEYLTSGAQFFNSIVKSLTSYSNISFRNCIVKLARMFSTSASNGLNFYNCILIDNESGYANTISSSSTICHYCIGIYYGSLSGGYFHNNNDDYHNTNYGSLSSVFKYFNGSNYTGFDFDLQDSVATNVLGNDSTQVGVYGGMVPFNPRVNTPRYVRANVAPHTTLDGKLSVDIEVVSE